MSHGATYYDMLLGKNLSLLGGGPKIHRWRTNKDPDLFVHCNNHWIKQGGDLDVLYFNGRADLWDTLSWEEGFDPGFIEFSYNGGARKDILTYCRENGIPHLFHCYQQKFPESGWYHRLKKEMDKFGDNVPFIGTAAVYHLLQFPIAELFVTGMDFYTSEKDPDEIRKVSIAGHNPIANAKMIAQLSKIDSRLILAPDVEMGLETLSIS